ncbi:MAG: 3-hydroxyacyl-ACP dehydratase [Nitrospinae bacterium RIFCSPLOWO2_12_FULL_45_22]|nr:MAG: 3-hydroxyacyl-ACP dehydratase [Nitrospinae bacterium RIFCSPLOWO2_12_FULL_45_22]
MLKNLGIDIGAHDQLMQGLQPMFREVFLSQKNRPKAMSYFDFRMSEIHGCRIRELSEHKEKGGKVIGAFCLYVPEEIVLAAGGMMVGLCAGADIGGPEAEQYLPRNICPLIRSSLGMKLSRLCPYFELADLVVGETTCDGKKKAWEIFQDLIPLHVMHLPAMKGTKAQELWLEEMIKFKEKVEEITGNEIDAAGLKEAIARVNRRRAILKRLNETRKISPTPISGKDALLVTQLGFSDDIEQFLEGAETLRQELEQRVRNSQGAIDAAMPRLMVSGCPMVLPNWKIHHIVETNGGAVVCEEACTGQRYFRDPVEESDGKLDNQLRVLSDRYLKLDCACFTPNDDRINNIIDLAQQYRVDGVIYNILQFCTTYAVEFYRVEKALKGIGVPVLRVETDYSQEDIGPLTNRLEAFLEMIRKTH